jgi:hypothetical protein
MRVCGLPVPRGLGETRFLPTTAQQQVLLLRRSPVGREQLDERLTLFDRVERRSRMQLLDETTRARLHDEDPALVPNHAADRFDAALEAPASGFGGAHAQVLCNPRVDRDAARAALLVRVLRDEVHVHERRLARLVEALLRNHRVVPVENLSVRGILAGRGDGRRDARSAIPVTANGRCNDDENEAGENKMCVFHGRTSLGSRKLSFAQALARSSWVCSRLICVSVSARRASSTVASSPRPPR